MSSAKKKAKLKIPEIQPLPEIPYQQRTILADLRKKQGKFVKTTTPDGYRDYMREYMRRRRKQKRGKKR